MLAGEATQCQRPERNACRGGNVQCVRGTVRARAESTAKLHGKGDACGWHRRARAGCTAGTRSMRVWTALFRRTWQTTEFKRQETCGQHRLGTRRWQRQSEYGWHRQAATPGRVQAAPPGSDTWNECGKPIEAGPSCRSCTASPQRRRCVTVPSLIETICELWMTRTNREAWFCAHSQSAFEL